MKLSQIPVGILFENVEDLDEATFTKDLSGGMPKGQADMSRDMLARRVRGIKKSNPASYKIMRKNLVSTPTGTPEAAKVASRTHKRVYDRADAERRNR